MSKILYKKHKGYEIPIADVSVKRTNYLDQKNEAVTIIKILHAGLGSEEDIFIFYYNKLLDEWILDLERSLISMTRGANCRLQDEVYSKFSKDEPIEIQQFADLICDTNFDIFVEANYTNKIKRGGLFKRVFSRLLFLKKLFQIE